MKQLTLFADLSPDAMESLSEPHRDVRGQLDLFSDRHLLLSRAREALVALDPLVARGALREALARYPSDSRLAEEIARLEVPAWRIEQAFRADTYDRGEAFLSVADTILPVHAGVARKAPDPTSLNGRLWSALLRKAAAEAIAVTGDASMIRDVVPGFLLLVGGDVEGAQTSLDRALQTSKRARFASLRAECLWRRGDHLVARQLFLSAFCGNPYDIDFDVISDTEIANLPSTARYQFEIENEAMAWVATVGVVTQIFHLPTLFAAETSDEGSYFRDDLSPAQLEALEGAAKFLAALGRSRKRAKASSNGVIAARRTMKKLCPQLFEVVLERV